MFRCLTAVARCAATAAVLVASTLPAAQAAHRDIGGWTVEDRPNGSTCSLYRSEGDRHFQLESNGEFHVVGPGIDGADTGRSTTLELVLDDRVARVEAEGFAGPGGNGYSFRPRRRPSFQAGFDIALRRGEDTVFSFQVRGAGAAYEEMLECASDPWWPG